MKTKWKLKEGITKQDLINSKWDQSTWSDELKVFWQETMFELGFGWDGLQVKSKLDSPYFWCNEEMLLQYADYCRYEPNYFEEQEDKQLFWSDIFEPIEATQPNVPSESVSEPLQEDLQVEEYNWVKVNFESVWEAVKAFEEGTKLYYKKWNNQGQKDEFILISYPNTVCEQALNLYTKEAKPWWESVSEDNPVYTYDGLVIQKLTNTLSEQPYASPLTEKQVKDIVSTMEKWND